MDRKLKFLVVVLIMIPVLALLPACTKEEEEEEEDGLGNNPPVPPTGPAGTFLQVGDMVIARLHHKALRLPNGDVLVIGGEDSTGAALATPEFYEYNRGEFLGAPFGMNDARVSFTATSLMGDGRILVCGGRDDLGTLDTAELFDPSTYDFTATIGTMGTPRRDHAAIQLLNGNVFICGGKDGSGNALDTCEIYDLQNDIFIAVTNPMTAARSEQTVSLMDN
ncbi:MAG: kelch repeat-containing protein, partial [Planctomycetota bacterium]